MLSAEHHHRDAADHEDREDRAGAQEHPRAVGDGHTDHADQQADHQDADHNQPPRLAFGRRNTQRRR
jgi:hypothetical protein